MFVESDLEEFVMEFKEVDFAFCPAGHATPIRRTMPPELAKLPQSIQTGNESLFVACILCPVVFRTAMSLLKSRVSTADFLDEHSDAQYQKKYVSISCDREGCDFRVSVLVVRNAGTTDAAIEAEIARWTAEELECAEGHKFSLPSKWL